jgi:hypothetical protein
MAQDSFTANQPSVKDATAYLLGTATPEQTRIVEAELKNSKSPIHPVLHALKMWTKEAFSDGANNSGIPLVTGPMRELNAICAFIEHQQQIGTLSEEDLSGLMKLSGMADLNTFPRTPAQATTAAGVIRRTLCQLHPDLFKELNRSTILR